MSERTDKATYAANRTMEHQYIKQIKDKVEAEALSYFTFDEKELGEKCKSLEQKLKEDDKHLKEQGVNKLKLINPDDSSKYVMNWTKISENATLKEELDQYYMNREILQKMKDVQEWKQHYLWAVKLRKDNSIDPPDPDFLPLLLTPPIENKTLHEGIKNNELNFLRQNINMVKAQKKIRNFKLNYFSVDALIAGAAFFFGMLAIAFPVIFIVPIVLGAVAVGMGLIGPRPFLRDAEKNLDAAQATLDRSALSKPVEASSTLNLTVLNTPKAPLNTPKAPPPSYTELFGTTMTPLANIHAHDNSHASHNQPGMSTNLTNLSKEIILNLPTHSSKENAEQELREALKEAKKNEGASLDTIKVVVKYGNNQSLTKEEIQKIKTEISEEHRPQHR